MEESTEFKDYFLNSKDNILLKCIVFFTIIKEQG